MPLLTGKMLENTNRIVFFSIFQQQKYLEKVFFQYLGIPWEKPFFSIPSANRCHKEKNQETNYVQIYLHTALPSHIKKML